MTRKEITTMVTKATKHCQNIEFIKMSNGKIDYANFAGYRVTQNPTWRDPKKDEIELIVDYVCEEFNL